MGSNIILADTDTRSLPALHKPFTQGHAEDRSSEVDINNIRTIIRFMPITITSRLK